MPKRNVVELTEEQTQALIRREDGPLTRRQAPAVASLTAVGLHALGGRRWSMAGWIDRAGLAIGICWIALMLLLLFL